MSRMGLTLERLMASVASTYSAASALAGEADRAETVAVALEQENAELVAVVRKMAAALGRDHALGASAYSDAYSAGMRLLDRIDNPEGAA